MSETSRPARRRKRPSIQLVAALIGAISAVAAAVIAGVLPVLLSSKAADAPPPSQPAAAVAPAAPLEAMVFVRKVELAATREGGAKWDLTDEPDPQVEVHNLTTGQVLSTPGAKNVLVAQWNAQTVRVRENDTIQVSVQDGDMASSSDPAGKLTRQITRAMLEQGKVVWSFDQVVALELEFR